MRFLMSEVPLYPFPKLRGIKFFWKRLRVSAPAPVAETNLISDPATEKIVTDALAETGMPSAILSLTVS